MQAEQKMTAVKQRAMAVGQSLRDIAGIFAVGALARGFKNLVVDQIESADALKHQAEMLGITSDELQKYQYVSDIMGVATQQTAVALRFFNRAVGEAALGTKSAVKVFGQLGIAVRGADGNVRPTDELLFEFADKLKGVHSQAIRTALAMRTLGRGGAALLPVLQNGSAELRKMFAEIEDLGGGYTEAFVQQSHEIDLQFKRLRMGWRSVYVAIATEVMPIVKAWTEHSIKTVKHLIDLSKHTYFFRTALVALAGGAVFFAVRRLMSLFAIGKMTVEQWFALFLRNAPLVAFVALITAAYLILDDLYTFLQGGDSVLGRFLDQVGGDGAALKFWKELRGAIDKIEEALTPVADNLREIAKGLFKAFIDSVPFLIKWAGIFAANILAVIDSAVTGLKELGMLLTGSGWTAVERDNAAFEKRLELYKHAKDVFDSIGQPPSSGGSGGAIGPSGPELPGVPGTGGSAPIHVETNITINGATDPAATGREVGHAIKGAVKDAAQESRDTWNAIYQGLPVSGF